MGEVGRITYVESAPRTADLVIVGGGVVGAATAFYATRAGLNPLLIERRPALCTLTTPVSTGAFRLQFDNPEELRLVQESVALFLNFHDETRQEAYDVQVQQPGYLFATTNGDRARRQKEIVDEQHRWGQTDIELLDGTEVRRRFPWIDEKIIQARYRAGDGFLDPKGLTLGLVAGSGAPVMVDTGVTGFRLRGDRLEAVVTTAGEIATERAVIACGPLSGQLCGTVGTTLPIETVTRHKLVLPDVPEAPREAPMTIDDDTGAHWRPALLGAYVLFTDPSTPPTPATDNVPIDPEFAFRVLSPASPSSIGRVAPFWNDVWARGDSGWILQAGQYTNTPDHRPLLGPIDVEGLFANTGYSGHGIMASPAGSRHLIDVIVGDVEPRDSPFRIDRPFETRRFDRL